MFKYPTSMEAVNARLRYVSFVESGNSSAWLQDWYNANLVKKGYMPPHSVSWNDTYPSDYDKTDDHRLFYRDEIKQVEKAAADPAPTPATAPTPRGKYFTLEALGVVTVSGIILITTMGVKAGLGMIAASSIVLVFLGRHSRL